MANVYVDSQALESWKLKMNNINEQCIDEINQFKDTVNKLGDIWSGNSSESYIENFNNYSSNVLFAHEKMKDMESFLDTVVETMNNQ